MALLSLLLIITISLTTIGLKFVYPEKTNEILGGESRSPEVPPVTEIDHPEIKDNLSNGLVLFDSNLNLIYVNDSIYEILPESPTEPESLADIARFDNTISSSGNGKGGYTSTLSNSSRLELQGAQRKFSMKVVELGRNEQNNLLYAGWPEHDVEN